MSLVSLSCLDGDIHLNRLVVFNVGWNLGTKGESQRREGAEAGPWFHYCSELVKRKVC